MLIGARAALSYSGQPLNPCGSVVTPSGWVVCACSYTNSVYAVDVRTGQTVLMAGSGGAPGGGSPSGFVDGRSRAARFYGPRGLVLCPATCSALIADCYNDALRSITLPPALFVPHTARA